MTGLIVDRPGLLLVVADAAAKVAAKAISEFSGSPLQRNGLLTSANPRRIALSLRPELVSDSN
jgi:hypothetical protein